MATATAAGDRMASRGDSISARPPSRTRWRFGIHFGISIAILAILFALHASRGYEPNRPPDALDFVATVCAYLAIPAMYGVFAIVPWCTRSSARTFFEVATLIGVAVTTAALGLDLTLSGVGCRPDCVAAVPSHTYYQAAFVVSLLPAVAVPALLGFVRWPKRPRQAGD
jgi:hypothetical protein